MPETDPCLTIRETAELLRVSVWKVNKLLAESRLGCFRDGRIIRIYQSDIDEYLANGRHPALNPAELRATRLVPLAKATKRTKTTDKGSTKSPTKPIATSVTFRRSQTAGGK